MTTRTARPGLTHSLQFATPGVHPYDEVVWEVRDVIQTNWQTGETVFEQRGVDFPKQWSINSSTIVTTKYFRGAVNTETRENSLKQLIDRVVKTYTKAARDNGYFATKKDVDNFSLDLTWLLLHQYFAFNSPVWFNVGTNSPQQVSACQPYNAMVNTENGFVPIGELVENNMVGTKVLNADGSFAKILAVKNNGVKKVLEITTKSGHVLEVTGDHLVWKHSGGHSGRFVSAEELNSGDQLIWRREESPKPINLTQKEFSPSAKEAALAGWLLTDGFVGQYDRGTNRSLTVEAISVNDEEYQWVTSLISSVLPGIHSKERHSKTIDEKIDYRRIRFYGEALRPFVKKWDLDIRGVSMKHPEYLDTAPLEEVSAYLRSIFQADGYVNLREKNNTALIGLSMESKSMIVGAQRLLQRLGIFSRVHIHKESRENRNDRWVLGIQSLGDRRKFASSVGFISSNKNDTLSKSLEFDGKEANSSKVLTIDSIKNLGEQEVYDIQTDTEEYLSNGIRVHNCFILAVDDTMDSILNWYREEGLIFKGGSGAGLNLSRIRSSKELLLSSGGTASGPVSFMRGADASAGTIKSGGACLAPWTEVYTAEHGPKTVKELAELGHDFSTVAYNPLLGRVQAVRARAWLSGNKQLMKLVTDKGQFTLSKDHPVLLMDGQYIPLEDLKPGMSIRPGTITINDLGYEEVGLYDGNNSKEGIHRLVAQDITGAEALHGDRNHANKAPSNLEVASRSEHYTAYKIVNNGGNIETFESYVEGRKKHIGHIGSITKLENQIESRYGSYENFVEEVRANNHAVISVEPLEFSDVYDVEVDNDTPRDKSENDGHNFLVLTENPDANRIGYTGIFVSNTRRAAKMVVLDVDHPDIEEFIETKAHEEEKIRVLRDAGFDMDLGGSDIISVQYQNANNSVRVSDEFMRAVDSDSDFDLLARTDGSVIETVSAKKLFRKMAEAAWACADPGIQYNDAINKWHTNAVSGPITASNPCSEYMSVDNSSCNLASLNLMKFRRGDGSFDYDRFILATEIIITAMEISISFADFPTEAIGDNTRNFRQLGIGYANLGALLMASGVGYDSPEGRALASAITSLMTGVAYRRSAEIAGVVGPYAEYEKNKVPHDNVMHQHEKAASALVRALDVNAENADFVAEHIVSPFRLATPIAEKALAEWDRCLAVGEKNGWRNAQASVLAPTGTIGFMMDCDTTGVEPDFSLLKFKKLVGGGSMQIVNQQAAEALSMLGYHGETIEAIKEFIVEHGHIIDAPGLKPEHYTVFDCAVGDRAISALGHIRMMAAVQPFISGAISKTVNLPETATVEEIEDVYYRSWRLGLKALAVYRDNCKVGQPLSASKSKNNTSDEDAEPKIIERIVEKLIEKPARARLPKKRSAETVSFTVGGSEGYLTAGLYEDGSVGELFVKMSKQGSTLAGIMDAFSIAMSLGLQYGVPLEAFVHKFTNMRFEPAGMTDDPDVRMAQSLLDYMFRRIALDHMPFEERAALGIYTTKERADALNGDSSEQDNVVPAQDEIAPPAKPEAKVSTSHSADEHAKHDKVSADAPLCMSCGTAMTRSGSCWACLGDPKTGLGGCGATSGCS